MDKIEDKNRLEVERTAFDILSKFPDGYRIISSIITVQFFKIDKS